MKVDRCFRINDALIEDISIYHCICPSFLKKRCDWLVVGINDQTGDSYIFQHEETAVGVDRMIDILSRSGTEIKKEDFIRVLRGVAGW